MKNVLTKNIFIAFGILLFFGCKSYNLPTVKESQDKQIYYESKTDSIFKIIRNIEGLSVRNQSSSQDITLYADIKFINKLSSGIANQRSDDLKLNFFRKQYFMKEDKSALGISYTNYLNIDSGFVSLDLKKFNFTSFGSNKVNANLELEGNGFLQVSGKYMGLPASVSPEVIVYLFEPITFKVKTGDKGNIMIVPQKKSLMMKTKFQVNLLGWKVPYYQEIPLELTDMLQPLEMPMTMSSEISLPLPAQKFGKDNIHFAVFQLLLTNQQVGTVQNKLIYKADMTLKKK